VFGSVNATSFTIVSATQISAVVPPQAAGSHNVYVVNSGGSSALVAADVYTYTG
jgi:uncharacterized protein (TIGR03437 family)